MIYGAMSGPFYNLRLHVSAGEHAAAARFRPALNNNSVLFPHPANEDSKRPPSTSLPFRPVHSSNFRFEKNGNVFTITATPRVAALKFDEETINEPLGSPPPPWGLNIYYPRQNPTIESDVPQTGEDNGNNSAPVIS